MKECNDVVAFGLNIVEFGTVWFLMLIAFGISLVKYLNKGIGERKSKS
ncbi:hypothetical protein A54_205 [Septuagintavirus sv54]|uniref:Uncharacterized protein n=1 Tax=Escherichia phage A5-4 TaxID=2996162 RepID=A0AAE9PRQ5_9CAUD|nr:hypothetical protein A54_205 [Escherichia phage A5-4]